MWDDWIDIPNAYPNRVCLDRDVSKIRSGKIGVQLSRPRPSERRPRPIYLEFVITKK